MTLAELVLSANTGADAIKKAPIVEKNTGLRCLRIGDISQKREYSEWGFTKTTEADYMRYKLEPGDLIIARTGNTIGVNCIIEDEINSVYNNGLIRIKVDESKVIPRYFWYMISSKNCQDFIQAIAYGTSTQPNMKIKDFLKYSFEYRDLNVQKKVVEIIDPIDKKIKINMQINRNLSEQAQAYFDELFIQNASAEWKEGTLSDVGSIVAGGTPFKSNQEYYTDNGIAWITPKDLSVDKSVFISHGENDITELGLQKSSATMMPAGTVLFSSRAPIGYIAIAANDICTNQGFKSVVPNGNVGTSYVYYLLKQLLPTIENMASGSTFKEISGSAMKIVPTVIPDDETLKRFSDFCDPIMKQIWKNEQESKRLVELRDSLLPKLMSGDLDVSDLDI